MKHIDIQWTKDGFLLRPIKPEDAADYYEQNFHPLDPEVARLTGSKPVFSRDEVISFFYKCLECNDRFDFLILDPLGRIIGETVLNDIDWDLRKANFRITIFHSDMRGKGIGSWAIAKTRDFAFEQLKLHRLELNVFSFNPRAKRAYEKAGFRQEGILRDAVWDGSVYGDDILMAILEEDFRPSPMD